VSAQRLEVLARPAFENRRLNPYNHLLYSAIRSRGVRVDEYFPHRALGRYDVFHVHWPESTFNQTLLEALITTRALLAGIDCARARGARLVWTVHNLAAHEHKFPEAERRFFREFVPRVDGLIALSAASVASIHARFPELAGRPLSVVPHHHYADEYPCALDRSQARARLGLESGARVLLFFGRIASYKGLPALLEAVRGIAEGEREPLRLVIAGAARDQRAARELRVLASRDARVRLQLGFLGRSELGIHLRAADLVVLPYTEILNSGSALLAQSFERPVLMPRSVAFPDLQAQFGADFVLGFERLDPVVVERALDHALELRGTSNRARLAAVSPQAAAERTLAAYRKVLECSAAALERSA
jgi:glycosyltransferase involved in cell wall biosynthesis